MNARNLRTIIAGGRSRRYGKTKALAGVGGTPIIARVAQALRAVDTDVVALTGDAEIARAADAPGRPDVFADLGALGGIHTGLLWALEEQRPGILAVACDMPFLSASLLRQILDLSASGEFDLVAPEGGGPRIIEPLCAWYGVACIAAIEEAIERGDHRLVGFHGDVRIGRIPLDDVTVHGPVARLFLNVNSPADRERAESMAQEVAPD